MPSFETLLVALLAALAVGLGLVLLLGLRRGPAGAAQRALGEGNFAGALAASGAAEERDALYSSAVAARHLLDWERAEALVDRLLAADARDGEAWLERALVEAYRGDLGRAEESLQRAAALRSDLAEPIALHRAWVRLRAGQREEALRLFEEIEAPLLSKFEVDFGTEDPLVAEWLLHAGALWEAAGDTARAAWARAAARRAAPQSRLREVAGAAKDSGSPDIQ